MDDIRHSIRFSQAAPCLLVRRHQRHRLPKITGSDRGFHGLRDLFQIDL